MEEGTCERSDREYNVPLRVGLLFVILVTGALGVYMPIIATSFTRMTQKSIIFVILKQFGTGVVLSTAFIHVRVLCHVPFIRADPCIALHSCIAHVHERLSWGVGL